MIYFLVQHFFNPWGTDMYDIIGDIHGYADELEKLLLSMNYNKVDGVFQHKSNKVIF